MLNLFRITVANIGPQDLARLAARCITGLQGGTVYPCFGFWVDNGAVLFEPGATIEVAGALCLTPRRIAARLAGANGEQSAYLTTDSGAWIVYANGKCETLTGDDTDRRYHPIDSDEAEKLSYRKQYACRHCQKDFWDIQSAAQHYLLTECKPEVDSDETVIPN